jgi:hypothetical protein
MVCANRSAAYIRELDVFRAKLGIEREKSKYEVASQNELRGNLQKFLIEHADHSLRPTDGR